MHHTTEASEWIRRWTALVPDKGSVMDVACGFGRHMRWFHQRQHAVVGVDRSPEAVAAAAHWGHAVEADIEAGPWPFLDKTHSAPKVQRYDAVVVCNYLWRPLLPTLVESVKPGGVLLYETFAAGNETVGRPSRPDFLLQPGELLQVCEGFKIVAYEDVYLTDPPRFVQRIAACRLQNVT